MLNGKLKTAFILSIVAMATLVTYSTLSLCERFLRTDIIPDATNMLWFYLLVFIISPIVLAIVALSMIRRVEVYGKQRVYLILTRVFSWSTIGLIITGVVLGVLLVGSILAIFM